MKKEIKRICQSCKALKNRDLLIKITKLNDDTIKINPESNETGRSAYVCKNKECIEMLIRKKRLNKALKCSSRAEISKIEDQLKCFVL